MDLIARNYYENLIHEILQESPAAGLLGPRQVGKSTLAQQLGGRHCFDLENPVDLARLEEPLLTLGGLEGLIVIDEVQRQPALFPVLRYLIDESPKRQFLLLGSASRDLIRASSESLAGRIQYVNLPGFNEQELGEENREQLWLRGGFPRSYLSSSDQASMRWRQNFITDFLERDIPQLGIQIPARKLRLFWTMVSHFHGGIVNYSEMASSLDINDKTARNYLDILEGTYMVRLLQPWHYNTKKRIVKRPKLYLSDSGIFHTLQTIESISDLKSNPKLGASWEGYCLTTIQNVLGLTAKDCYFWAIHNQGELDLVWKRGGRLWGVEIKYGDAPKRTKAMELALSELQLEHLWVIYPGKESYSLSPRITAAPLSNFLTNVYSSQI